MKLNIRPMDLVKNIYVIIGLVSVVGGAVVATAYAAGWLVNEARASELAKQEAVVVQQQLYEAQQANEKRSLLSEIEVLNLQIAIAYSKPDRSDWENAQIKALQDQVTIKQTRLAELDQPEATP
jgi:hypothetical protein